MSRGALIRLLLVLGLLAGCVALGLNKEPRLGLDLRGGAQFILQAESTEDVEANAENVDKAVEVLRGRVDALGVSESTLIRQGEDRILVELPGVDNADDAEEALGQTAQLTIHPVIGQAASLDAETNKKNNVIYEDAETGEILELGPTALTGDNINSADAVQPQQGVGWEVSVDFDGEGSDAFGDLSGTAACETGDPGRIAIVLDEKIISSPDVSVPCGSRIENGTNISGNFNAESARDLAILIEGGALPLPVTIISDRLVGPTLGAAAIDASIEAGIIGLILTGLFIFVIYRLVGGLATIALASYALLSYAMLLALGSTLTLPGLAGFVLAIGLAIDANVLVFERAREEYAENPRAGMRRALQTGFNKAWTAIIDSNVTTLLAAALLFLLASGPVKGFGVTLSIGVIASMISALVIARVLTEIGVSTKVASRKPGITGLSNIGRVRTWLNRKDPDLMSRRRSWLGISGAAMVLALIGIFGVGLNLGVEFTGGRTMDYSLSQDVSIDDARDAVAGAGYPEAVVQTADTGDITVRTSRISDAEEQSIQDALGEIGGTVTKEDDQQIGASLGTELRNKALIAFGIALAVQMLYLAVRFKWTFGVAAVIAMFHDVIIVTGVFAWLGKPIDGVFLAAALTIIGLSVNDTVVVFDRIRERWTGTSTGTFPEVANRASIETMPRTVNTGLGAMFILAALAVLGGDSLRDFAIALLIGLAIGTYSSVFTATPLLTYFQERAPFSRERRERKERDPEDSGAVV
ncbi:protein translocase subunit SecD [Nocardioides donggukensis]|uniref:Multifunctional fusion protein n=1 Tax=Nocardioides donggukensis TaxID=2774019 RepID=A0A927Q3I6_9ACTN|nr:protein translocase subunit SecD [Nocardioides donggukensis]MBD8870631.1 protein translocase subunit SecD [Nocardioides donggukensis]